jgi:pyruvate/2-oxoglutarate dehydrogenase complex dihydrolipoamide acyltransferase (E2) component
VSSLLHPTNRDHHFPSILPGNAAMLMIATRDEQERANLCLACDHHVVNGRHAAAFLGDVATSLLEYVR